MRCDGGFSIYEQIIQKQSGVHKLDDFNASSSQEELNRIYVGYNEDDEIDYIEFDISFKAIYKAIHAKSQFEFCNILGVGEYYTEEFFKKLYNYIFPKKPAVKSKKSFDFKIDFRLLWADFKSEYNIDLLNDDINWWEFQALFERISLLDNVSGVNKVIGYRTAEVPRKNKNNKQVVENLRNMKARYRLEDAERQGIGKMLDQLFYNKEKKQNKK